MITFYIYVFVIQGAVTHVTNYICYKVKLSRHRQMKCSECQEGKSEYSLEEVSQHCYTDSCWMVYADKAYDITQFVYEVCYLYELARTSVMLGTCMQKG